MSEAIDVTPGSMLELKCPAGATPTVKAGEFLQTAVDKNMAYVVRVEGASAWLGPMEAGEYTLVLPCTEGSTSQDIKLTAIEQDKLPEKSQPLVPQSFAYPTWAWVVLFVGLFLLAYLSFYIYSRRKPKANLKTNTQTTIKVDPETDFIAFVSKLPRLKFVEMQDNQELLKLYAAIYEKLRAFLDKKLNLNASIETTREFMVTFRAAALKFKVPQGYIDMVEQVLLKCDDVRFAGEIPLSGFRQQTLANLEATLKAFRSTASNTVIAPVAVKCEST